MRIQQLMIRVVWVCRPSDGLDVPARMMKDHGCSCVIVVDEDDRPVAVLTDRDVCLCAVRTMRPLQMIKVSDAMSSHLYACRPEDPVADAEATMALRLVRRLPVVDRTGRLVGIVSLDDIARGAARDLNLHTESVTVGEVGLTLARVSRPRIVADPALTRGEDR